jgi:thiamine pyrophosphate-dependent acetolactate synthase large subunit-like protein
MALTGGELLLELFEACGIEYIFCSPGTEWTPVWEGLLKRHGRGDTGLKYINCRHETLAISMAMGYAETTGRLPAVLLHASVGALSGGMAMRNACAARVPMIIFSGETYEHYGDEEVRAQGWHWLGLLSDMGGPPALVENYVKWSNAVKSRDGLIDSVSRGCQIAMTAPRGPAFLSIPTEILQRSRAEAKIARPYPVTAVTSPRASDLLEVARLLIRSKQPIIIAENAGKKPGAVEKLTELAELLSIPVFEASLPYTSNFSRNHPLYQGHDTSEALKQADTVFVVSGITPWYPPSAGPGNDARVIMLDEAPLQERLPFWGYRADLSIAADIGPTLAALADNVRAEIRRQKQSTSVYKERLEHWRAKHDRLMAQSEKDALAGQENKPIATRWFCHTARKALPADAIILDETLTHTRFVHQYLAEPGCYIKSAYGGLGVGMGEALGVKLARPDRPVILMVGDGAFNYNPVLAGLGLSQEYQLPVFIIICDNGGYMAMKFGYHRLYPQGSAVNQGKYLGVDIAPAPDYAKVAEAFGAYGERLEEPGEIEAALKRGLEQIARGKTALLDVVLENTFPMMPERRPG